MSLSLAVYLRNPAFRVGDPQEISCQESILFETSASYSSARSSSSTGKFLCLILGFPPDFNGQEFHTVARYAVNSPHMYFWIGDRGETETTEASAITSSGNIQHGQCRSLIAAFEHPLARNAFCDTLNDVVINKNDITFPPLLALAVNDVFVSPSSALTLHASGIFSTIPPGRSVAKQRLPSCSLCMRRVKRFQSVSRVAVARSFSDCHSHGLERRNTDGGTASSNILAACNVCTTYSIAQTQHHQHQTDNPSCGRCTACGLRQNLWVCMACGYLGCGRYSLQHAQQHAHSTSLFPDSTDSNTKATATTDSGLHDIHEEVLHSMALELATGRIWDYKSDEFVHYEDDDPRFLLPLTSSTSSAASCEAIENNISAPPLRVSSWKDMDGSFHVRPQSESDRDLLARDIGLVLLVSPHSLLHHDNRSSHLSSSITASSTSSMMSAKLDRVAAEYERLLEQQLREQQMHFEKLIARETVRALQAQYTAATHSAITPAGSSSGRSNNNGGKGKGGLGKGKAAAVGTKSAAANDIDAHEGIDQAVDEALHDIEQLKIQVSAAEAMQLALLGQLKEQQENTRRVTQRCDVLVRRQRQLRQLEETLLQREKETHARCAAEVDELQQQIRDLTFYLDTQRNKDIMGGSVHAVQSTASTSVVSGSSEKSKNDKNRGKSG